jgi:uncharacterized protein (TIGR03084 family)
MLDLPRAPMAVPPNREDYAVAEQSNVMTDLVADGDVVDAMVAGLDTDGWNTPTPATGWTIRHQIAHLTATFKLAGLAAADGAMFKKVAANLSPDFDANVNSAMSSYLDDSDDGLLRSWRHVKRYAENSLAAVPQGQMVPWLVRPLPATMLAAAGMMELFGHGQDIADALGVKRPVTDRLGHIVAFAVRTWDFGYESRGLSVPDTTFRFEITAPSGAQWNFGPADSSQRITGHAHDFCLLVTRRRHYSDLALVATGDEAVKWLDIAQAYRGPSGSGRKPGQFASA